MNAVMTLDEASFDAALADSPVPLLVDFWAEGCGPCMTLAPLLDDLAREAAGRLRVATVRLDDNPGLAARFEIMALPTLIAFTDGQTARRLTSIRSLRDLTEQLHGELGDANGPARGHRG
jgi:thioredoxin 1